MTMTFNQTEYMKEWSKRNPDKVREYRRNSNRRRREEVIAHYGGKCECCGETTYEFLGIDHIEGGGGKHRKELATQGHTLYTWLKKNNYPEGFRVLCHNCNMAIGFYGSCPHMKL